MNHIFLFIIFSIVLVSCHNPLKPITAADHYYLVSDELEGAVDVTNGIDLPEARTISEVFFIRKISGCGYPRYPKLKGNSWFIETLIGQEGKSGPPIYIHRNTGAITWSNKYKNYPLAELKRDNALNRRRIYKSLKRTEQK